MTKVIRVSVCDFRVKNAYFVTLLARLNAVIGVSTALCMTVIPCIPVCVTLNPFPDQAKCPILYSFDCGLSFNCVQVVNKNWPLMNIRE